MIVLGIQIGLAIIASIRGWGFAPFGVIIGLAFFGFLLGTSGLNQFTFHLLLTLDWLVLILLAGAAIFAPEKEAL